MAQIGKTKITAEPVKAGRKIRFGLCCYTGNLLIFERDNDRTL